VSQQPPPRRGFRGTRKQATWIGAIWLVLGVYWTASAVFGGAGWFTLLLGIIALVLGVVFLNMRRLTR
jgi:apolipoprotein N-acyltransferase